MAAMLEETATVTRIDGEWLWVETKPKSACSHCSEAGCSTSVIGKVFGNRRNELRMRNSLAARPGQQVVVGIPEEVLIGASLRAYLAPIVVMLMFGLVAISSGMSETFQALFSLFGLFAGLYWSGRVSMRPESDKRYSPRLLRVLPGMVIPLEIGKSR